MKVVVTGSRNWYDRVAIYERLAKLPKDTTIIHGASGAADQIADRAAKALKLEVISVPAEWEKYGKAAGPLRNSAMLQMEPDLVLAFRLNMSKGTSDCVTQAHFRGIPVEVDERKEGPNEAH